MDEEAREFEARAITAEDDIMVLRVCIKDYQKWLAEPIRGPVIYRLEVIEHLSAILET